MMEGRQPDPRVEEPEGRDQDGGSWGDYPTDALLIRHENRTIHDIIQRIDQNKYVMDPDFQRDFIWPEHRQSKLIESVIMRIPLPVFYLAEDDMGRRVVVDGLQRLSTLRRFVKDELRLLLPDRKELHDRRFSDLSSRLQNRVEGCNLILYIIDSKTPEGVRLDIFERVNSGEPLTRQQMRNSLFMGKATRFLKEESRTGIFLSATGGGLDARKMRDRELVNRFCAFQIIEVDEYHGDMDDFLAECLRRMNGMSDGDLASRSREFRRGLANNVVVFGQHAFRKRGPGQDRRGVLNASFWDVMSTGLSRYGEERIEACAAPLREAVYRLLDDEEFNLSITSGPNDARKVRHRFRVTREKLGEVLGGPTNDEESRGATTG